MVWSAHPPQLFALGIRVDSVLVFEVADGFLAFGGNSQSTTACLLVFGCLVLGFTAITRMVEQDGVAFQNHHHSVCPCPWCQPGAPVGESIGLLFVSNALGLSIPWPTSRYHFWPLGQGLLLPNAQFHGMVPDLSPRKQRDFSWAPIF